MLRDDTWIERQLADELRRDEELDKIIRLHQLKIEQAKNKIRKVEEGFDGGLYTLDEAKQRKMEYQAIIEKATLEIPRFHARVEAQGFSQGEVRALREELNALRERNLKEATFDEKVDLVAMLGIKIYPSEDLKSRRVACRLNLRKMTYEREQQDLAKVMFGGAYWTERRTFTLAFHLII